MKVSLVTYELFPKLLHDYIGLVTPSRFKKLVWSINLVLTYSFKDVSLSVHVPLLMPSRLHQI